MTPSFIQFNWFSWTCSYVKTKTTQNLMLTRSAIFHALFKLTKDRVCWFIVSKLVKIICRVTLEVVRLCAIMLLNPKYDTSTSWCPHMSKRNISVGVMYSMSPMDLKSNSWILTLKNKNIPYVTFQFSSLQLFFD